MAYGIDHLVLPVGDLDIARARLDALGFTVAPDARHPFGTKNACVFFQNRTYLEPLAVADVAEVRQNAANGLDFLSRFVTYRERNGADGFSKLALTTPDAASDLERFRDAGLQSREVFSFERKAANADGSHNTIGVRLAFAIDERAPDTTFFACQHINTEIFWQPERTTHANSAIGIGDVVLCAQNPAELETLLRCLTNGGNVAATTDGLHVELPKGAISVLNPEAYRAAFNLDAPAPREGARLGAFVVDVAGRQAVSALLTHAGIGFEEISNRLIVPPAPGQGAVIAFQEKQN